MSMTWKHANLEWLTAVLQDSRLRLSAKGIAASHNNLHPNLKEIVEGRGWYDNVDEVLEALDELEHFGYVEVAR